MPMYSLWASSRLTFLPIFTATPADDLTRLVTQPREEVITGQAGADPGAYRHHTPDTHDEWDRAGGNASGPSIGA